MNSDTKVVLLDIEGTVAPVTFVYDVMFPFVRQHVGSFLKTNWNRDSVQAAVGLLAIDVGHPDTNEWFRDSDIPARQAMVVQSVHDLMDRDAKVTGLKQLQGLIWKDGFDAGQLVAELFPDVLPKLREWKTAGLRLFVYSSGSIGAQKLFFGHTTEGNLLELFEGHFDTTSGNKKEQQSYRNIANQIGVPVVSILFISDVVAELQAAAAAGMQTLLRPVGEPTSTEFLVIGSFAEI